MSPIHPPTHITFTGERGVLREVFIGGNLDINSISARPHSMQSSVVDKLDRGSDYDTPVFGENTRFTQRYTGFFVPPVSSLYTFNVRSDDLSRLYFSANASSEVLGEPIIDVREHTRRR